MSIPTEIEGLGDTWAPDQPAGTRVQEPGMSSSLRTWSCVSHQVTGELEAAGLISLGPLAGPWVNTNQISSFPCWLLKLSQLMRQTLPAWKHLNYFQGSLTVVAWQSEEAGQKPGDCLFRKGLTVWLSETKQKPGGLIRKGLTVWLSKVGQKPGGLIRKGLTNDCHQASKSPCCKSWSERTRRSWNHFWM